MIIGWLFLVSEYLGQEKLGCEFPRGGKDIRPRFVSLRSMTTLSFPAISEFIFELSTLVRFSESLKKEVDKKDKEIVRLQRRNKKLLKIINDLSKRSEEEVEEIGEVATLREFLFVEVEKWPSIDHSVFAPSVYEAAKLFSEKLLGGFWIPEEPMTITYQFTENSGKALYEFTAIKNVEGTISTIWDYYTVQDEEKTETKKLKDKKMDVDTFFNCLKKEGLTENWYHPHDKDGFVFREIEIRGDRDLICIGFEDDSGIHPLTSGPAMELRVFLAELGVEDLQTLEEVKDRLDIDQLKKYRTLIPTQPKIASPAGDIINECLELNKTGDVYYWSEYLMFCKMKISGREEIVCVGSQPMCEYDKENELDEFMYSSALNYFYMQMLRDFEKDSGFSVLNIRDLYLHGPEIFSECQGIVKKLIEAELMPGYD